jgi:protein-disulfide isomerase
MSTLKVPVHDKDHIRGNKDAPITLLEYGDYQCSHCGAAHVVTKALLEHFGEDMRYVYRHFPLTSLHPYAELAAETAELAGLHGHFWEMHDMLFANQEMIAEGKLADLLLLFHLPAEELEEAVQDKTFHARVRGDFMSGVKSSVSGTPTFFINNRLYGGSYDFDSLVYAIDHLIPNYVLMT